MSTPCERRFLDPEVMADPFSMYDFAVAEAPVMKVPGENVYGVFSYDLINEVVKRTDEFSSDCAFYYKGRNAEDPDVKQYEDQGWPLVSMLLTTDPPLHTPQRKLVNMAFSKPRVDAIAEKMQSIVSELIDGFIDKGHCDFVAEFATPLPVRMISGEFGLDDLPVDTIKRWSDACIDRTAGLITREREIECAKDILEFQHVLMERVRERRARPSGDLLSDLVNAKVAGERPLDDSELLSLLQLVIVAGNESTTSALGLGLLMLIQHPEKAAIVRADHSKIPNMVEEMLRYDSPISGNWRVTTRSAELGGVTIPAKSMVNLRFSAANRDTSLFACPHQFDPDRKNARRHMSFGSGIHTCVGNMLARREMAIAFEAIFNRMTDIELVDDHVDFSCTTVARGLKHLNIKFRRT